MKPKLTLILALLAALLATPALAEKTGKKAVAGEAQNHSSKQAVAAEAAKPQAAEQGIPMVRIAPGSFTMGSNNGEKSEQPAHRVSINYAFEIGKYEVTQGQYEAVMGENPSKFNSCGDDCPVENVSWEDAKRFIKRLNIKTGKDYRLPTEAEWEYACRAGGDDTYCGGNDLDKLGWYQKNSGGETTAGGKKQPNVWGLYDMSGNVWEWVEDAYHQNYNGAPTDGSAWEQGGCPALMEKEGSHDCRVHRGGSWFDGAQGTSAAGRGTAVPTMRLYGLIGFRLARTLP